MKRGSLKHFFTSTPKAILIPLLCTTLNTTYAETCCDYADGSDMSYFYFQFGAGVSLSSKDTYKNNVTGVPVTFEYSDGWDGLIAIGYRFDAYLRLELQGLYIDNDLKRVTFSGFSDKLKGYAKSGNVMVNGYLDIDNDTGFIPYVGAGIGYSEVRFRSQQDSVFTDTNKSKMNKAAYQLMAGFNYELDDQWEIGLGYSYFRTQKGTATSRDVQTGEVTHYKGIEYTRNLVNVMLTYHLDT